MDETNKLKSKGSNCASINKKRPKEHFEAWKKWTQEHGITPTKVSKYEMERKIAEGMGTALKVIRREEQYKEILEEYEKIYAKYGRKKDFKSPEEHFNIWKKWTNEHGITPNTEAENEAERKIAVSMANYLVKMRKKQEQYKEILEEYEKIYTEYGIRKDFKSPGEHFEVWKKWTEEHGITPRASAKNETERRIAQCMANCLVKIRKKEEQYKEILEEYEKIYTEYGIRKDFKSPGEHFEVWKKWTEEHGITPSRSSIYKTERKIAEGMRSALIGIKKNTEQYKEMLEEYEAIRAKYGRRKLKKLQEQKGELLEDVTKLKEQAKESEKLDNKTKDAVQNVIDEKSQKHEDIGE